MHLSDINIDDTVFVKSINIALKEKRRLYDLGFTNGALVKLLLIIPSKHIKAYLIRNSVIALRNSDASKIEVDYV